MLRFLLYPLLSLSLLGCSTLSAPPEAELGIARRSPDELTRLLPKPEPRLPPAELIRLSKASVSAADLIARTKETGSSYALSASQLIELHGSCVSAQVLDYIQSAREQELFDRIAVEINQREQRHAEELRLEQELRRNSFYYGP